MAAVEARLAELGIELPDGRSARRRLRARPSSPAPRLHLGPAALRRRARCPRPARSATATDSSPPTTRRRYARTVRAQRARRGARRDRLARPRHPRREGRRLRGLRPGVHRPAGRHQRRVRAARRDLRRGGPPRPLRGRRRGAAARLARRGRARRRVRVAAGSSARSTDAASGAIPTAASVVSRLRGRPTAPAR